MKGALVALLAVVALSCSSGHSFSGGPADGGGGDDGGSPLALTGLTVSTGSLRPAFDPGWTDYDMTSLNSLYPIAVTATAADPGATITLHGAPAQSGVAATFQLQPKEDFTVVVSAASGAPTTYTVHYVPADLPPYAVKSYPGAGTEDVLVTPDDSYLLMVDRSGAPLYYRTFAPSYAQNFQQVTLPTGQVVYTANVGELNPQGWTLGADHVMDQHFVDIGDYQLGAHAQHGVLPAEGHEFLLLGDQHYVAMTYLQRTLDLSVYNPSWSNQSVVMSNLFQEVDHGNVLFEWDSASVPALYTDSQYENQYGNSAVSDYLHLNSITIDPGDGNFIVSFRHTSSIVKMDRHSGQIVWTMGGVEDQFGLTAEQTFSMQHYVRIQPDGTMTVFDNGYPTTRQTRILSFGLDQANHKVTSFQVLYTKPATDPQTTFMGSETPLAGGRIFCGWGGWYSSAFGATASEESGGNLTWTIEFPSAGVFSYRALPIASP
ncbi:MAG TPA: arylsulfotransferase family protein [Polyangiaceae bacterium]